MRYFAGALVAVGVFASAGGVLADPVPELAAKVPANLREAGVLRVGSQQTFPPVEFKEEGQDQVIGASADLLAEIASRLDLKLEYIHGDYAALIPGLDAGRFDVASGGISDTEEREQKVDFVNYMMSGASILLRNGDGDTFKSIEDYCGKSISTMLGGRTIMAVVEAKSAECQTAGKGAITAEQLPAMLDARAQLDLKRVDGYIGDFPALAFMLAKEPGKYEIAGGNYLLTAYVTSWAFPKDSTLTALFQATTQGMLEDGSYEKILDKWGLKGGALPEISINLPASKR
ncbi:ABC transporter substrate-binding protein [Devosia sp. H5989]|nr:ABC transporter substrate-binding protein [Devosia sp. H5989]